MPALYRSKLVKTRKKHKCVECNEHIAIGEKAEKVDAIYDGSFQTFYTCLQCQEIIEFIRQEHEDDLLKDLKEALCCHGELYELLSESVFDSQEEEEGYACHYRPNVSWLNPFVQGKLSLNIEAKL
jgi:hypothetical protein